MHNILISHKHHYTLSNKPQKVHKSILKTWKDWMMDLKFPLWSFLVNKHSYVYIQCFSPKLIVCILEA